MSVVAAVAPHLPCMLLYCIALLLGLVFLVLSADRFVDSAAAIAHRYSIPPLLIGILIIGIGTSAPEMLVSAIAASNGTPGLALGNAYGSNIANIGLILGLTALISPIPFESKILRKELPILCGVTFISMWLLFDGVLSRIDAVVLVGLLFTLMAWLIASGRQSQAMASVDGTDTFTEEAEKVAEAHRPNMRNTWVVLVLSLVAMMLSSQGLIWGAEHIARALGVSDLLIGLTILAFGTSVPELAASLAAARKGQHALALGNVLGSNLFNTLGVVGIAGLIAPGNVDPLLMQRDLPLVALMSLSLFIWGVGFRGKPGRINRLEGGTLLVAYLSYITYLATSL